jgi:DNA repair protein RadC
MKTPHYLEHRKRLRERFRKAGFEGFRKRGKRKISSTNALIEYCTVVMSGLGDEQFRVIFLNSQNEVMADEVVQEGPVDQSVVYPGKVMERALYHKAGALVFVHNHPGGSCRPGYFRFLERGLL